MNFFKRMIAALVVFFVVIKVLIFDTYAFVAAPVAAETLIELFGTLLVASGINTQEEVNDMSWSEVSSGVQDGLYNGTINPADVVVRTTVNGVETKMSFMDWLADRASETAAVNDVVDAVLETWWKNLTADDVIPSYPGIDTNGYSVMIKAKSKLDEKRVVCVYWNNYIEVSIEADGDYVYRCVWADFPRMQETYYNGQLDEYNSGEYTSSSNHVYSTESYYIEAYGDVRYPEDIAVSDGTAAYVGETEDGEPVTLEQIQSGEIPLDDVVIDWEKLDETSLIELMKLIIIELEQVPVIEDEDDNTIAEDIADSTTVTLEAVDISSLQVPTGIATVFPFCLPFDFAYGLQLLASKPVPPKFEIPFEIPAFGLYPGTKDVIVLDMAEYSKYFEVGRWVQVIIFAIGLCFISFKVVKGVH